MTTRIDQPLTREAVTGTPRRAMTYGEKLSRWTECGMVCVICKRPCAAAGPTIIWDHRVPLALGGSNDLENMEPHHVGLCAMSKTQQDRKAIAKAKRLERDADPATRRRTKNPLRSRGFQRADPLKDPQ